MYSSISWIPKGKSASKPVRAVPTQREIEEYKKILKEQNALETLNELEQMEQKGETEVLRGILGDDVPMEIVDPSKDPNIEGQEEDMDSEEEDDLDIRSSDHLLIAAKSADDQSSLEFHVYDEESGNFYLHHDVLLAAFPLCIAWLDCYPHMVESVNGHPAGSYVAVGTFHPEIEIWNADVVDGMEPECILGGQVGGKKRTLKAGSHRQAVMGLSWNKEYRNLLASSSADTTVKLWDVTTQRCMVTMSHHKDKVPIVEFHPVEANVLLSASYDRICAVTDGRSPNNGTWIAIPNKPESAKWNIHAPYSFYVTTEEGDIMNYDVRNTTIPLLQQKVHEGPCTAVSINPRVNHLLVTSGEDGMVKLWEEKEKELVMVGERNVNLGNVFGCSFYESAPYLLAACGASQDLCLWDIREIDALAPLFDQPAQQAETQSVSFVASQNASGSLNDIKKKKN